MTGRLNIAAKGARSVGTIRTGSCPRCGEAVSVRCPSVPVHQLNHERERAERAEVAARHFARALSTIRGSFGGGSGQYAADALAAHPDFTAAA